MTAAANNIIKAVQQTETKPCQMTMQPGFAFTNPYGMSTTWNCYSETLCLAFKTTLLVGGTLWATVLLYIIAVVMLGLPYAVSAAV